MYRLSLINLDIDPTLNVHCELPIEPALYAVYGLSIDTALNPFQFTILYNSNQSKI